MSKLFTVIRCECGGVLKEAAIFPFMDRIRCGSCRRRVLVGGEEDKTVHILGFDKAPARVET